MQKLPDVIRRLTDIARKADPEKNPCEHERHTSAMVACKILRENANTLASLQTATPSTNAWAWDSEHEEIETPPPKPSEKSKVHPKAAALREWIAFKKEHGLFESDVRAPSDALCNSCGDRFHVGEALVGGEHGWTHRYCAEWWWAFDFPARTWPSAASAPSEEFSFDDPFEIPYR